MGLDFVVIPEDTETCRSLFEEALKKGEIPPIFPGMGKHPRGILGNLVYDVKVAPAKKNSEEGRVLVMISQRVHNIPKTQIYLLSKGG